MNKKIFLLPLLTLGTLTACGKQEPNNNNNETNNCPTQKECPTLSECPKNVPFSVTHPDGDEANELHIVVDNGKSYDKHLIAKSSDSNVTFSFKSSDETVAVATNDGLITGITPNKSCTITVTASNGYKREISVTTHNFDNQTYYTWASGTFNTCVDKHIEELAFPTWGSDLKLKAGLFRNQRSLKKAYMSDGIITINDEVFTNCPNLEYISFSQNTTFIGYQFNGFNNCKEIEIRGENSRFKTINNNILVATSSTSNSDLKKSIIGWYNDFDGDLTKQEYVDAFTQYGVDKVYYGGLAKWKGEELKVPNIIARYSNRSFARVQCDKLYLPTTYSYGNTHFQHSKIKEFAYYVDPNTQDETTELKFADNRKIVDGTIVSSDGTVLTRGNSTGNIPEGITSIGDEAFYGAGLQGKFKIPSTITAFGKTSFVDNPKVSAYYIPSSIVDNNIGTANVTKLEEYFLREDCYTDGQPNATHPIRSFAFGNDNLLICSETDISEQVATGGSLEALLRTGFLNTKYEYKTLTEAEFDAL